MTILSDPFQLLPPLKDKFTYLVIVVQVSWTWIFIYANIGKDIAFDTSSVFNILTATLGFILPLQMNSALTKNRECIDNYNAMVGDLQAVAWDIIAFHTGDPNEVSDKALKSENILSNMFDILIAMPALSKWHFRGGVDLDKLTTKNDLKFLSTPGGYAVYEITRQIPTMPTTEACFFKLLDYTKDLTKNKSQIQQSATIRSWERAYGSWGNMGNISSYKPPSIFSYVLNTALLLYSVLLPFQFANEGYNAVWMVLIVGYFFLGLSSAGRKVGNAFAEQNDGFQTVSETQRSATQALKEIWKSKQIIFQDPVSQAELLKIGRKSTFLGNLLGNQANQQVQTLRY